MPLLKIHRLGNEQSWGLWHITETEEVLSFASMESCPEEIVNRQKRSEWLAARVLIKSLLEEFGLSYQGMRKDESGKPFLKRHAHQISLSHSHPYVTAQIDRSRAVGIDLEQPKEKLRTIAPRVFSPGEVNDAGDSIVKLCIYWCAKEALYKIHGKRSILFSDHLRIMPFTLAQTGQLVGTISLVTETVRHLRYLVEEDYVVVYTDVQN